MNKQTQRSLALAARRAMSAAERASASELICRALAALPEVQAAGTVFSYLATPEEADLSALHRWLAERGCRVAFPVTQPGGIMEAFAPDLPWRFERGLMGIRCPVAECASRVPPEQIDLVLAPCVGFDGQCRRLGHGGGYYDRFLPRCTGAVLLGVAFEAQRLDSVVCGPLDLPMDAFVTERGLLQQKK